MSKGFQKDAAINGLDVKTASMEFKAGDESDEYLTISGYGSVFDVLDNGGDIVIKGAFKDSLTNGRKPKMLWQHDPNQPIGVWDSIVEDSRGLKMAGRIIKTTGKGAEVAALVKAGAIDGLSIGYRVMDGGAKFDGTNRELSKLELWETSIVTFPMNEAANIHSAKSCDEMSDDEIEAYIENALSKIRVPAEMAKSMAACAMDGKRENTNEIDQQVVDELKSLLETTLANIGAKK